MREAIYESLAAYLDVKRTDAFMRICASGARRCAAMPGRCSTRSPTRMRPAARSMPRPTRASSDGFSALSKEMRRPMLLAYLGFPFFDIATLPLLQGEGMDEFDPITRRSHRPRRRHRRSAAAARRRR